MTEVCLHWGRLMSTSVFVSSTRHQHRHWELESRRPVVASILPQCSGELTGSPPYPPPPLVLVNDVTSAAKVIQRCEDKNQDVWVGVRIPCSPGSNRDIRAYNRILDWLLQWGFLEAASTKADIVILHQDLVPGPGDSCDVFREVRGTGQPFHGPVGVKAAEAAIGLENVKAELWRLQGQRFLSLTYQL